MLYMSLISCNLRDIFNVNASIQRIVRLINAEVSLADVIKRHFCDSLLLIALKSTMGNSQSSDKSNSDYHPTIADIIQLKELLTTGFCHLPIELADQILDEAEYWAHSSVELTGEHAARGAQKPGENVMYMRTMPLALSGTQGDIQLADRNSGTLNRRVEVGAGEIKRRTREDAWLPPRSVKPARKIVFQIESRDQGWSDDTSNHDSYRGSYTWFDAGVESILPNNKKVQRKQPIEWTIPMIRDEHDSSSLRDSPVRFVLKDPLSHPFLPPPSHLQRNLHAAKGWRTHIVELHHLDTVEEGSAEAETADAKGRGWQSMDGTFVRGLCVGDCITLWMRARFPGWVCSVRKAKIDVFWAV